MSKRDPFGWIGGKMQVVGGKFDFVLKAWGFSLWEGLEFLAQEDSDPAAEDVATLLAKHMDQRRRMESVSPRDLPSVEVKEYIPERPGLYDIKNPGAVNFPLGPGKVVVSKESGDLYVNGRRVMPYRSPSQQINQGRAPGRVVREELLGHHPELDLPAWLADFLVTNPGYIPAYFPTCFYLWRTLPSRSMEDHMVRRVTTKDGVRRAAWLRVELNDIRHPALRFFEE